MVLVGVGVLLVGTMLFAAPQEEVSATGPEANDGIPLAIDHGKQGLLVAERDPEDLGRSLSLLCSNPDRLRALGRAARAKAAADIQRAIETGETLAKEGKTGGAQLPARK